MTYNIRYASPNDGDNLWDLRKDELVNMLHYYHADFIGMQEVMPAQLNYIAQNLDTHNYIGYGRDGVDTQSEAAPIFYNRSTYELIKDETMWLSETPSKISKGWDAALNRIAIYGVFRNKLTNEIIHIINTHFDHRGEQARAKSAELLVDFIRKKQLENEKIILMGDLNCLPTDAPMISLEQLLEDSYKIFSLSVYGPVGTFNGFDVVKPAERRIDYILTRNVNVKSYRCIDDRRKNNLHLSDHFAVLIEI